MGKVLPLAYYGEPVLRRKADEITEVNAEIRELIDDMKATLEEQNGLGLAAPQVHRSLRLFLIWPDYEDEKGEWTKGELTVFINPKLSQPGNDYDTVEEGCLSIPGVHGYVDRPTSITVEALDEEGNLFTRSYKGMEARIVMHENDHINGVLYPDRMDKKLRKQIEPRLQALKKKLAAARREGRQ